MVEMAHQLRERRVVIHKEKIVETSNMKTAQAKSAVRSIEQKVRHMGRMFEDLQNQGMTCHLDNKLCHSHPEKINHYHSEMGRCYHLCYPGRECVYHQEENPALLYWNCNSAD